MRLIDGKKIAEKVKDEIVGEILEKNGQDVSNVQDRPNLAIIMAGSREDSNIYVKIKREEAKKVGVDTHFYQLNSEDGQKELLQIINHLNQDEEIDAILIQMPLPERFDADEAVYSIDPNKDADCFHPKNMRKINDFESEFLPPVFGAIREILKDINFDFKNKKACIIGNSEIFGKNLGKFLALKGVESDFVKSSTSNLAEKTNKADLLISVVGKPGFITKDFVKEDAVVIDVGIVNKNGKVLGDVNLESVKNKASHITPVPGGVGPLTVAMLLKNTLTLSKLNK
ncbi:MAG: bifunctional 5,10-methylenetetrahydrofolate dehydrogenase/5,10-methenyltetrahydrofolate cyclohydrolase [Candidatus Moraniibacteriota bacterium]